MTEIFWSKIWFKVNFSQKNWFELTFHQNYFLKFGLNLIVIPE